VPKKGVDGETGARIMATEQKAVQNKTRNVILNEAYRQFCSCGYRGANINTIVTKSNITKGALYYYFNSKKDLALAVVDDIIITKINKYWTDHLEKIDDPIKALRRLLLSGDTVEPGRMMPPADLIRLLLELIPLDNAFRQRLGSIHKKALGIIADSFRRAMEAGKIIGSIDPDKMAASIMAGVIGGTVLSVSTHDINIYNDCRRDLVNYLETLRSDNMKAAPAM